MSSLSRIASSALLVVAATTIAPPAARAGLDISFGANVPVADDGHLFFSISSHYFDRDVPVVETWGRRFTDPDDLSVFLFITQRSGKSPDFVFSLRRQGLGWFEIGNRCGVPVDAWYVPVAHHPGPPYGRAYGYWDKHKADPHYRVQLTDHDARDLVAVRMAHEYYGVSPEVAMDWRRNGESTRTIMNREYRSRHGHGDREAGDRHGHGHDDDQGDHGHGNGHGGGNGHGNGHGHDKN